MRAASLLLLAAALPSAGADRDALEVDRLADSEGSQAAHRLDAATAAEGGRTLTSWQKFSLRFCVSSDVVLECDDHSVLDIYSAFYGRASLGGKCKPNEPVAAHESCARNFTDAVIAKCQGQQSCPLAAAFHPTCGSKPHYSARVVWECTVSEAKAETPEEDEAKNTVEDDEEVEGITVVPTKSTEDDDKKVFKAIAEETAKDNALPAAPAKGQEENEEAKVVDPALAALAALKRNLEDCQSARALAAEEAKTVDSGCEAAKAEVAALKRSLEDAEGKARALRSELDAHAAESAETAEELRSTKESIAQQLSNLTKEKAAVAAKLTGDKHELQLEVEKLMKQIDQLTKSYDAQLSEQEKLHQAALAAQASRREQIVGEKDAEFHALKAALAAEKEKETKKGAEIQALKTALAAEKEKETKKDAEIQALKAALAAEKEKETKKGSEIQALKTALAAEKEKETKNDAEIQALKAALAAEKEKEAKKDAEIQALKTALAAEKEKDTKAEEEEEEKKEDEPTKKEEEEKKVGEPAERGGGDAQGPTVTTGLQLTHRRCYRRTQQQMVEDKKFGKNYDCPRDEHCFGLVWDDMRKYADRSQPPDAQAMSQAKLAPGRSFWVSWLRVGLRYNNKGTWGICLPNKKGVAFCKGNQKATECRRLVYKIFAGLPFN